MGIKGKVVTLIADFDPHQGESLMAVDDVFTQQFLHIGRLANKESEDADEVHTHKEKSSHSILTFFDDISKLKEGTYKWNPETKKWDFTSCKK